MSALSVAVIATHGFSPFHFSVPCIIFGQAMPEPGLFDLHICAEHPGVVHSDIGVSINVGEGLEALDSADIVVVPFWNHPESKPSEALLASLVAAWQRGADVVGLCLEPTYWPTPGCWIIVVRQPTGNLNATLPAVFPQYIWIAMRFIPMTIVLLLRPAPRRE